MNKLLNNLLGMYKQAKLNKKAEEKESAKKDYTEQYAKVKEIMKEYGYGLSDGGYIYLISKEQPKDEGFQVKFKGDRLRVELDGKLKYSGYGPEAIEDFLKGMFYAKKLSSKSIAMRKLSEYDKKDYLNHFREIKQDVLFDNKGDFVEAVKDLLGFASSEYDKARFPREDVYNLVKEYIDDTINFKEMINHPIKEEDIAKAKELLNKYKVENKIATNTNKLTKKAKIVLEQINNEYFLNGKKGDYSDFNNDGKYKQISYNIFVDKDGKTHKVWEFAGTLDKKAENFDFDEAEEFAKKIIEENKYAFSGHTDMAKLENNASSMFFMDSASVKEILDEAKKIVSELDNDKDKKLEDADLYFGMKDRALLAEKVLEEKTKQEKQSSKIKAFRKQAKIELTEGVWYKVFGYPLSVKYLGEGKGGTKRFEKADGTKIIFDADVEVEPYEYSYSPFKNAKKATKKQADKECGIQEIQIEPSTIKIQKGKEKYKFEVDVKSGTYLFYDDTEKEIVGGKLYGDIIVNSYLYNGSFENAINNSEEIEKVVAKINGYDLQGNCKEDSNKFIMEVVSDDENLCYVSDGYLLVRVQKAILELAKTKKKAVLQESENGLGYVLPNGQVVYSGDEEYLQSEKRLNDGLLKKEKQQLEKLEKHIKDNPNIDWSKYPDSAKTQAEEVKGTIEYLELFNETIEDILNAFKNKKMGKQATIKHENGVYNVYSESGKCLGKGYKTKEEAEKRLKQVEYFKNKKSSLSRKASPFQLSKETIKEMVIDALDVLKSELTMYNKQFNTSEDVLKAQLEQRDKQYDFYKKWGYEYGNFVNRHKKPIHKLYTNQISIEQATEEVKALEDQINNYDPLNPHKKNATNKRTSLKQVVISKMAKIKK